MTARGSDVMDQNDREAIAGEDADDAGSEQNGDKW